VPQTENGGQRDGAAVTGAAGGAGTPTAESTESVVGDGAAQPTPTEAAEPTTLPGDPTEPVTDPGTGGGSGTGQETDGDDTDTETETGGDTDTETETGGDTGTGENTESAGSSPTTG
jgi:hypothetical protein